MTFSTTTAAMAMEEACNTVGIPGRLIPVPQSITASCGLSWRIQKEDYPVYADRIRKLGISFEKIVDIIL